MALQKVIDIFLNLHFTSIGQQVQKGMANYLTVVIDSSCKQMASVWPQSHSKLEEKPQNLSYVVNLLVSLCKNITHWSEFTNASCHSTAESKTYDAVETFLCTFETIMHELKLIHRKFYVKLFM